MSVDAIAAIAAPSNYTAISARLTPATAIAPPNNLAQTADSQLMASMSQLIGNQPGAGVTSTDGLFDKLVSSLGEIDQGMEASGRAATELALGKTDNLHQVMIGAERTRLEFELAMSMRNRVLEAYQELMRMQV